MGNNSIYRSLSVAFPRRGEDTIVGISPRILVTNYAKDFFQASKGDTILALKDKWVIIVNLPYERTYSIFRELEKADADVKIMEWKFRVLKENEERKYVIAELIEARMKAMFSREVTRENIDYDKGKDYVEIYGLRIGVTRGEKVRVREVGEIEVTITPERVETTENITNMDVLSREEITAIDWRVIDEKDILGSFMRAVIERQDDRDFYSAYTYAYDHKNGIYVELKIYRDLSVEGKVVRVDPITEEDLKELSEYYTVTIPVAFTRIEDSYLVIQDVFYKGQKNRIVETEMNKYPKFFVRRHRYSISSYAKRKLPKGYKGYKVTDFVKFVKETLETVRSMRSRKKIEVSDLEKFLEKVYENTPKKKVKIIEKWVNVFNRVKDLAPKATLYIIFYGQEGKYDYYFTPKYVGFRIDKDGKISVLPNRVVPVSGIVFKGGEFEKRYREAYKIDRLIKYQAMSKEKKLATLITDIEEVRKELRENGVEPSTSPYKDVESKLKELALQKDLTDNVVWIFLKYAFEKETELEKFTRTKLGERIKEARKLVIGLIKTGKPSDFVKLTDKILPAIRTAIKYTVKVRGYSQKKGVMFLGNPEDVWAKVLEALKNIKGRALALVMEEGEEKVEAKHVKSELSRKIEALLEEIS